MTSKPSNMSANDLKSFVQELSGFAATAEETLSRIEKDLEGQKGLFNVFYERMLAIRGTAVQLHLPTIAKIAGLGEEIAFKATTASSRPQLRRCVSSLWDALTTTKYLLEHYDEETSQEQEILVNRLNDTLRILGGPIPQASQSEIDDLFTSNTETRIKRILVVDDDDVLRVILKRALERVGYEVECAQDGKIALEIFGKGNFDMVVTDVQMPVMDGVALLKAIRQTSRVPVLILTGYSSLISPDEAYPMGADAYLTKPVMTEILLEKILVCLAKNSNAQH